MAAQVLHLQLTVRLLFMLAVEAVVLVLGLLAVLAVLEAEARGVLNQLQEQMALPIQAAAVADAGVARQVATVVQAS